jgi:hypothetical protein
MAIGATIQRVVAAIRLHKAANERAEAARKALQEADEHLAMARSAMRNSIWDWSRDDATRVVTEGGTAYVIRTSADFECVTAVAVPAEAIFPQEEVCRKLD